MTGWGDRQANLAEWAEGVGASTKTYGARRAPARPADLMRVRLHVRIVLELLLCVLLAGIIVVGALVGMAVANRPAPDTRPAYCFAEGDARQSLPVCSESG